MAQILGGDASSCPCGCGENYYCVAYKNGQTLKEDNVKADSLSEAIDMFYAETRADQVSCTKESTKCGHLGE